MTRYGLYFSPAPDSAWWEPGCRWLGRDAADGTEFPQAHIAGIPDIVLAKLTADARRYGFHATLKAPFALADGFSETHLLNMAQAFCRVQRPIVLEDVQVRPLSDFLALCPAGPAAEINALAMRCVSWFDTLRAAPSEAELVKRRRAGLSPRQEALLQRWGYPYTEEEFRLHLTLTDSLSTLDADTAYAIRKAAEQRFAALADTPPAIDGLTIFREDRPGAPFSIWQRIPFNPEQQTPTLPAPGRLFYMVGPSGVGKDSLLQWLQQRVPAEAGVVFAQRTITRASHSSESYEATDVATFWQQAAAGHFSMIWQANDLCYGVRRGIEADLKVGRDVVINGSREYLPQLRLSFPEARIVWIEADVETIKERLESRRRESGPALLQRIDRAARFAAPLERDIIRLDNSGPLEVAGEKLLELFRR
jgi:phosphonate metabolism protein PhnN/1,5-bisphosphokinase (PRPP-forming)